MDILSLIIAFLLWLFTLSIRRDVTRLERQLTYVEDVVAKHKLDETR